MSDKVDFLHTDKHETFLAVDFNTFPIKVSYKVITSEGIIIFDGSGNAWPKYPT